jgi:hypothetical protein
VKHVASGGWEVVKNVVNRKKKEYGADVVCLDPSEAEQK